MTRRLPRRAALGWLASTACPWAVAQARPQALQGRVTIVVPSPPGGALDGFARLLAQALAAGLGQRPLVENRAGAAGLIAARSMALAPAGEHRLLCIHSGFVTLEAMGAGAGSLGELLPVARLSRSALVVTVRSDSPHRTIGELIGAVQSRPGALTYASGGIGSPGHTAVLRLAAIVGGFEATHVPYLGAPQGDLAVAQGDVDFQVGPVGGALPWLRNARVRALAVTSRQRLPALPGVATAIESGVPGFVVEPWVGMALSRTQASPAVVDALSEALRRAMETPDMAPGVQSLAGWPDFADGAALSVQIARELETERDLFRRVPSQRPR